MDYHDQWTTKLRQGASPHIAYMHGLRELSVRVRASHVGTADSPPPPPPPPPHRRQARCPTPSQVRSRSRGARRECGVGGRTRLGKPEPLVAADSGKADGEARRVEEREPLVEQKDRREDREHLWRIRG